MYNYVNQVLWADLVVFQAKPNPSVEGEYYNGVSNSANICYLCGG